MLCETHSITSQPWLLKRTESKNEMEDTRRRYEGLHAIIKAKEDERISRDCFTMKIKSVFEWFFLLPFPTEVLHTSRDPIATVTTPPSCMPHTEHKQNKLWDNTLLCEDFAAFLGAPTALIKKPTYHYFKLPSVITVAMRSRDACKTSILLFRETCLEWFFAMIIALLRREGF